MKISLELELLPPSTPNFITVVLGGKETQVAVEDLSDEDLMSVADAWFHAFYANVNERRAALGKEPVREPNTTGEQP